MTSLSNNFLVKYTKESVQELKKVAWPTRKTLIQHTAMVIGIALAGAVVIGAFDYGLTLVFQYLIK